MSENHDEPKTQPAGEVQEGSTGRTAMSPETASLLGLIDKLGSLLERSDLVELEVEAGETGIVLRKPAALAPVKAKAGAAGIALIWAPQGRPIPATAFRPAGHPRLHQDGCPEWGGTNVDCNPEARLISIRTNKSTAPAPPSGSSSSSPEVGAGPRLRQSGMAQGERHRCP